MMSSCAHSGFSSKNESSSTSASMHLVHVVRAPLLDRARCRAIGVARRRPARPRSTAAATRATFVGRYDRKRRAASIASSSDAHEVVAAAADGRVHARAAHLLERHVLADHDLGHARRAEVHRGVALDHEHRRRRTRGCTRRPRPTGRTGSTPAAPCPTAAPGWRRCGPRRAGPGNSSTWSVMRAPAESTRYTTGSSCRSACSVSRTIFSTVRAPHEPAFTVESFAITHTGRPSMRPTPVTTPSAGRSPASALASNATRW